MASWQCHHSWPGIHRSRGATRTITSRSKGCRSTTLSPRAGDHVWGHGTHRRPNSAATAALSGHPSEKRVSAVEVKRRKAVVVGRPPPVPTHPSHCNPHNGSLRSFVGWPTRPARIARGSRTGRVVSPGRPPVTWLGALSTTRHARSWPLNKSGHLLDNPVAGVMDQSSLGGLNSGLWLAAELDGWGHAVCGT